MATHGRLKATTRGLPKAAAGRPQGVPSARPSPPTTLHGRHGRLATTAASGPRQGRRDGEERGGRRR